MSLSRGNSHDTLHSQVNVCSVPRVCGSSDYLYDNLSAVAILRKRKIYIFFYSFGANSLRLACASEIQFLFESFWWNSYPPWMLFRFHATNTTYKATSFQVAQESFLHRPFRMGESDCLLFMSMCFLPDIFLGRSCLLSTWYFISHFTCYIAQQCFLHSLLYHISILLLLNNASP